VDTGTSTFLLGTCGATILLLLAVVAWFVKDRLRKSEKKDDALERRLGSGSEAMERIRIAIERLQTSQVEASTKLLSLTQFDEYRKEHGDTHKDLDARITELCSGQDDLRRDITGVGDRIEGKIEAMSDLLSKKVTVE